MLNQSRQNILLLVSLIGLVGITLFIHYAEQKSTILAMAENEISRFVIESSDKPSIRLEKFGSEWKVINTTQSAKANPAKVKLLLALATAKSIEQFEAIDTELFKYELTPPRLTVYLNDQAVHFGGVEPINQLRYVQINHTVHLVKDEFYRFLLSDNQSFIEP